MRARITHTLSYRYSAPVLLGPHRFCLQPRGHAFQRLNRFACTITPEPDEIYSLVERHHDGRPDMIGMEAINQLMVALEVHRFDFVFIGAGYEREVDEFLKVNPGLAGRFNRKLRFESYPPGALVEIASRYGEPRATVLDPQACEVLNAACRKLRAYLAPDGTHGVDLMQNGRFSRNVVERAERLRDSRVAAQHRTDRGSVTEADLKTLRPQDIRAAVADACAEKHVAVDL